MGPFADEADEAKNCAPVIAEAGLQEECETHQVMEGKPMFVHRRSEDDLDEVCAEEASRVSAHNDLIERIGTVSVHIAFS